MEWTCLTIASALYTKHAFLHRLCPPTNKAMLRNHQTWKVCLPFPEIGSSVARSAVSEAVSWSNSVLALYWSSFHLLRHHKRIVHRPQAAFSFRLVLDIFLIFATSLWAGLLFLPFETLLALHWLRARPKSLLNPNKNLLCLSLSPLIWKATFVPSILLWFQKYSSKGCPRNRVKCLWSDPWLCPCSSYKIRPINYKIPVTMICKLCANLWMLTWLRL